MHSISNRLASPISGGGPTPEEDAAQAAQAAANATPPPQYVPVEEFKRMEATLTGALQQQGQMLVGLQAMLAGAQSQQAARQQAGIEDATDDELVSGSPAAIRKAIRAESERLRREEIAPLRQQGTSAISGLVRQVAQGTQVRQPDGTSASRMPYYDKYKDEIDAYVGQMHPTVQMRPESLYAAHDFIVGQHIREILHSEREQVLRQASEEGGGAVPEPSGRAGRSAGAGKVKVPTVAELFGPEQAQAIAAKGQTPDEFARRLGHTDWPTYVKFVKDQEVELTGGA